MGAINSRLIGILYNRNSPLSAWMDFFVAHSHQWHREMAPSDRRHLVVARLKIASYELSHSALCIGLAAAATIALTLACGLHAFMAYWAKGHNHLLFFGQMEYVELLKV